MLELTFGEQVKIILSRKGMTIKELAEKIEKQTGKKKEDLSGIPVQRIDHYMTEGELTAEFGEKG